MQETPCLSLSKFLLDRGRNLKEKFSTHIITYEECIARFKDESDDSRPYDFDWGVVEVNAKSYETSDGVLDVTVSAKVKYGRTVIYRHIIKRNEN